MRIPDPKISKLASRAYECVFIGYAINSKAYRFYDLKNHVVIESNDVDFFEDKFPFKLRNSGGGSPLTSLTMASNTEHADSIIELINDEMDSLKSNRTWHLVDLPPSCKTKIVNGFLKRN